MSNSRRWRRGRYVHPFERGAVTPLPFVPPEPPPGYRWVVEWEEAMPDGSRLTIHHLVHTVYDHEPSTDEERPQRCPLGPFNARPGSSGANK